jgi:acetyl esterase/lipase
MRTKPSTLFILVAFIVSSCSLSVQEPKAVSVQRDVVYCTMEDVPLAMDVYTSAGVSDAPAIIHVHGGAWTRGQKSTTSRMEIYALARAGFVVFSINYRLAPEYKFPAMIEDVKCAVRSIRAHADDYHVDADRIGALGESAGGHLVALLGTSDKSAGFDVGEYLEQSSRVQAVVDLYGPADLDNHPQQMWGKVFPIDQLESASPVTYVSADDPPFLILHGNQDALVPFEPSQLLYERLTAVGVEAELVTVKNAGHAFTAVNGEIDPSREEITELIVDFFVEQLQ